jgi:septum site-determining protein MinC
VKPGESIASQEYSEKDVTLLRGRRQGLEIALAGRELGEALDELEARLGERPDFYRGTAAVANLGATCPTADEMDRLDALLGGAGIALRALSGDAEVEAIARARGLVFETVKPAADDYELRRRRALRPRREIKLSEQARSLVADFAGARADIADRRRRGEASVPRSDAAPPSPATPPSAPPPLLHLVETPPGTLYHRGTVRGGQALHHVGNIVVVGDVNPGAELVATGEILIFGRLAGVAHAGAQGDETARVYALDLDATQLRIATFIATDAKDATRAGRPEAALVRGGRIVVVSFDQLDQAERGAFLS